MIIFEGHHRWSLMPCPSLKFSLQNISEAILGCFLEGRYFTGKICEKSDQKMRFIIFDMCLRHGQSFIEFHYVYQKIYHLEETVFFNVCVFFTQNLVQKHVCSRGYFTSRITCNILIGSYFQNSELFCAYANLLKMEVTFLRDKKKC